jgi:type IV pilus assembly protein PilM
LADALQAAGARTREVCLVVPDAAVRVVLLDFDTLPDRKTEADAVVRFRLKKALPFDVDRAAVSYHAQPNGTTLKVIVAVMMSAVLAEYEGVVRDAGFQPGVVLPSTLAALGNVEGDAPAMVVKVAEGSTTIAILSQGRLLLYRTLDHGSSTVAADSLAEDIYPSVVFFQDMYGVPIEKVYLAGVTAHDAVAARLSEETSAPVEELISPAFAGLNPGSISKSMFAGVLGALA